MDMETLHTETVGRSTSQHPGAPVDRARATLLTRHEGGYAAQGPGFYVWDRDAAEVIRLAEALQAGRFGGPTTARFLVIEPGGSLEG
jgi:hypothetical protein